MKFMYRKLNWLKGQCYPRYGSGMMIAPFIKLTIGDYITDVPGFLKSMTITLPDDSPWEINQERGTSADQMAQVPHYIEIAIGFQVIGNILPTQNASFFGTQNNDNNNVMSNDWL